MVFKLFNFFVKGAPTAVERGCVWYDEGYADRGLIHCGLGGWNLVSIPFVLSTFLKF